MQRQQRVGGDEGKGADHGKTTRIRQRKGRQPHQGDEQDIDPDRPAERAGIGCQPNLRRQAEQDQKRGGPKRHVKQACGVLTKKQAAEMQHIGQMGERKGDQPRQKRAVPVAGQGDIAQRG